MGKKLLITYDTIPYKASNQPEEQLSARYLLCALYEGQQMIEAALKPAEEIESILNNIYIARVKNVVPNLNAAFVEFTKGQLGYLPLEDLKEPFFTKKVSGKQIAAGDEIVVQVAKEAMKTKEAVVTTNLSFSGEYFVLTSANHKIGISSKLSREQRSRLQVFAQQLKGQDEYYGMIVRTNAANAPELMLQKEFAKLKSEFEAVIAHAASRTMYSCLRKEQPFYMKMLTDADKSNLEEVVTDVPQIFETLNQLTFDTYTLRLYKDHLLPLARLYNTAGQIEAALKPRVWLKSGANIIIQPTEALTVIDVNSGKNIAKKEKQQNHYKINVEAAKEIAKQIRLRNLSGIIIVDFIDLYDDTLNTSLLSEFRSYLKQDPIPVQLVDITKLGLVELTRKKQRKPLAEQVINQMINQR